MLVTFVANYFCGDLELKDIKKKHILGKLGSR